MILNNINVNICKYLEVEKLECMDDIFDESHKSKTIKWVDSVNVGFVLWPRFIDKKRKKTFYAKRFIWIKNGKKYGCLIEPEINGIELDEKFIIKKLKEAIDKSN